MFQGGPLVMKHGAEAQSCLLEVKEQFVAKQTRGDTRTTLFQAFKHTEAN